MWCTVDAVRSVPRPRGGPLVAGALRPSGSAARTIDSLWWVMLALGAAVFALVLIALLFGLRRRSGDGTGDAGDGAGDTGDTSIGDTEAPSSSTRWIVGGGVVLPAVVVTGVLVATIWSMNAISVDGEPDLTIEVTGHQWWWEVTYPTLDVVTANEVHIPAGADIELRLRSADVIHSFWVPELAGKMDLLPERSNTLRIDAERPGRYEGYCAEFCGIQHANMRIAVVAHDPGDFDDWVAGQRQPAPEPQTDAARRGATVFVRRGCADCHAIRGTEADGDDGPDLTEVWSRERIAGGALSTDVANIRTWIDDPHAIKEGVLMPAVDLSDDELAALVAYLESLR